MFIFTIETILTMALVVIFILLKSYWALKDYIKKRKCDHSGYRETMACDAVCTKCSKNLGFIGTVRDKRKLVTKNQGQQ